MHVNNEIEEGKRANDWLTCTCIELHADCRNKCAHVSHLVTGLVDYHLAIVLEKQRRVHVVNEDEVNA